MIRRAGHWPLLLCLAALLGGCGSSGVATGEATNGVVGSGLQGLVLRPQKPEPPLALRNYTGAQVNLRAFRGQAVLVTFVYTHCPDVCPLIVSNLAAAQRQLGPRAHEVHIVAVTVDPKNDTSTAVRKFLAARGAAGRMDYLIGSRRELLPVWNTWGVAVNVNKYEDTEAHSALLFGITPAGKIAVVYSSNFTPAQIVHDVPLLERS
ncbi:MAG: SCO family protein [Solirubrobacterales bacterium]|nr:SCO family protein [Solirubrobacterales bacterium]